MMLGFKASSWPLFTSGSIAWNVNSVSARPSSPASNFMVGVQRPKLSPEMLDGTVPFAKATGGVPDAADTATAATEVAATATVAKVVGAALQSMVEAATGTLTAAMEVTAANLKLI